MAEEPPKPGGKEVEVKDSGAVVATGDGSGSSKADYDSWGWKEIMARITGSAAIGAEERTELGTSTASDPQTLWDAALSFRMVKEILASTGKSIADQTKALAGEGGPWRGEAAKAFRGLMDEFSKSFIAHATQIDGGRARLSPVPEQLWSAGNYLAWAIQTVHDIDQFYAREAQRIAAIKGEDVIIESDKGNLVHISKFPEIVKLLDRDMRQVLKTLAAEYEKQAYDTQLTSIPKPDPLGDGSGSKPPKIEVPKPPKVEIPPPPKVEIPPPPKVEIPPPPKVEIPPPPKVEIPPPPKVKTPGIPEVKPPDIPKVNTPEIPSPKSGGLSGGPGDFSSTPPPGKFDPNGLGGPGSPGSGGSGGFGGKIPDPNEFKLGAGPGQGGLPGGGGTPSPNSFKPGDFNASQLPGGKSSGGNVPPPNLKPGEFNPGNGPGGGGLPGGRGAVPPPPGSFVSSKPPASGRNGGNVPKPGEFKPGEFKPGEFPGGKTPPGGKVAPPGDFKPGEFKPGEFKPGDFKPSEFPGAKTPPAGHGAPPGDFKPGEFKPGDFKPGELKPGEFKPGEVPKPQDWTAGKGPGAGNDDRNGLGGGGMPMMPPGAPGAGTGGGSGGGERPDASGLIGGEVKPWEGSKVPGLGDPHGNVPELPSTPEEWASSQRNNSGMPGGGMPGGGMPMMPPGAPGAGIGGGSGAAERPDAAGLIGGEVKPWEGVELPGVGEPDTPGQEKSTPEQWSAAPPNAAPPTAAPPMLPPMPMAPGQGGAAGGSGAAERSDASGLVDGETAPWEFASAVPTGDPGGAETPRARPEPWTQDGSVPQVPVSEGLVPQAPALEVPTSHVPAAEGLVPQAPAPEVPASHVPVSEGQVPQAPALEVPTSHVPVSESLVPQAPAPEVLASHVPVSEDLAPQAPALEVPTSHAPAFLAPVPQTPVSESPVSQAPVPQAPVPQVSVPQVPQGPVLPAAPAAAGGAGERRREEALVGVPVLGADVPVAGAEAPIAGFGEDRVALVPVGGEEDFSAWDAGASGGLPWLPAAGALREEPERAPEKPDYTLRDSTAWGHSAGREGVVRLQAETTARPIEMSSYLPRFNPHVPELGCAGLDAPEPEEPVHDNEDEQDEEDERSSADLLRQDTGVWADGGRKKAAPGVIE
ncbi:hypothetical protein UK23_45135 [Lentzea aerocolonigenes]|uniref:Uncharacterized protein n=1 Tax=Lentzea aerocolonigenes TaxID=68170 RepID=A0A0F0GHM5_LENAE|nr:WXG100 family type VII secretion target [Lentzea aerocolonigenes]KJK33685.1 hypothetical protein UK23_45135 [Lentzea aerocolonigenes]